MVGVPSSNPGKGWQTQLKSGLQHIVINSYGHWAFGHLIRLIRFVCVFLFECYHIISNNFIRHWNINVTHHRHFTSVYLFGDNYHRHGNGSGTVYICLTCVLALFVPDQLFHEQRDTKRFKKKEQRFILLLDCHTQNLDNLTFRE